MVKKNAKEIINKHEVCHSNEQSERWSDLTSSANQSDQLMIGIKQTRFLAPATERNGDRRYPVTEKLWLYIQSFGKNILVIPRNNENCLEGGEGWESNAQVLTTNQISRFMRGFDS